MRCLNKRGSHVGVIISFIIFVTFLVFIYSISEPTIRVKESKDYMTIYINSALEDYLSTQLNTTTILLSGQSCVIAPNFRYNQKNLVVKNEKGQIVPFMKSGNNLIINNAGENFVKIYSSDEVFNDHSDDTISGCVAIPEEYSMITSKNVVSYSKLLKTITNFSNEYDSLKKTLEIPDDVDFSLKFKLVNGTSMETQTDELNKNIYAEEFAVRYLDKDANIQTGMLTVKVW